MSAPGNVAVIGGGTMGAGVAHAFLIAGSRVLVVETTDDRARAAERSIRRSVGKAHDLGRLPVAPEEALAQLSVTSEFSAVATAELVIEAVPESASLKQEVLAQAESVAPDAWLATNTSSLSVSGLSTRLIRPERLIGLHFFNPVPASLLVEIVAKPDTSAAFRTLAAEWVAALGKESIIAADTPGFATSRLGVAIAFEAMRMLEEGVASATDIDRAMELGYRHPVGPLRTSDLVGLDVRLAIGEYLKEQLGPRFSPPDILRDLVAEGHLGRKSGHGFFTWD